MDGKGRSNVITLAWVGVACSDPPILSMAIRPQRYSNFIISKSKQFVVNIPTTSILEQTVFCGIVSGKEVDKFTTTKLTPLKSSKVEPPLIKECPVNMECILKRKIKFGAHDLFLGEVVTVHVDSEILDEKGIPDFAKANPVIFLPDVYWSLGKMIGVYGLSKHKQTDIKRNE